MPEGKGVAFYRTLPYRRVVNLREEPGRSPYFLASIQEIPFIRIHGETREEALLRLDQIFDDCVQSLIEAGEEIPEPELWPGSHVELSQQLPLIPARNPVILRPNVLIPENQPSWMVAPQGAETVAV